MHTRPKQYRSSSCVICATVSICKQRISDEQTAYDHIFFEGSCQQPLGLMIAILLMLKSDLLYQDKFSTSLKLLFLISRPVDHSSMQKSTSIQVSWVVASTWNGRILTIVKTKAIVDSCNGENHSIWTTPQLSCPRSKSIILRASWMISFDA